MPEFDLASGDAGPDDAALATLATPGIDFSLPGARPAVLTGAGVLTAPGTPLRVSGYGITDTLPGGSPQLQSTGLMAVSDPDCQSFFGADLDRPTMLCAIAPGSDSCNGDSGGPLTLNDGTLVGLVSWGPETCADPDGAPGVYTELAEPAIAAFIRDVHARPGIRAAAVDRHTGDQRRREVRRDADLPARGAGPPAPPARPRSTSASGRPTA